MGCLCLYCCVVTAKAAFVFVMVVVVAGLVSLRMRALNITRSWMRRRFSVFCQTWGAHQHPYRIIFITKEGQQQ